MIAFTLPQNRAGKKFRIHLPRGPEIFSFHLPPVKYYLPNGYETCLINYRSSCPKYCLQSDIDCDKMSFLVLSQVKDTVEPRFNEPLCNEVLGITNDIF